MVGRPEEGSVWLRVEGGAVKARAAGMSEIDIGKKYGSKVDNFSVKRFRKANLTLDPRAFFRDPNLSRFGAGFNRGFMAPSGGGAIAGLGNMLTGAGRSDTPNFSGGIIGRLGAIEKLERRAAKGRSTIKGDLNLARIANMNSKGLMANVTRTGVVTQNISPFAGTAYSSIVAPTTVRTGSAISIASTPLGTTVNKAVAGEALTIGERRYMATMGVRGIKSRNFMQSILTSGGGVEMRTAMGTAGYKTFATNVNNLMPGNTGPAFSGIRTIQMTDTAEKLIRPLSGALEKNINLRMLASSRGLAARHGAASLATEIVDKGIIKSLGVKGAAKAAQYGGARVGLAVAGEIALKAVPGLNLIFAADMAYQLAKLAGKGIAAGINFGKDGMKSMQGNMYNGLLNSGSYKDDEVRATSRARGVAAIQNSRLNARSLLGSEGAMMAAHYG